MNMLLSQQRLMLNKGGIGFDRENKNRSYRSYFVKSIYNTCNYCGRMGHITHTCAIRNKMNGNARRRYVLVPKGQVYLVKPNPEGPKHKWVPKK